MTILGHQSRRGLFWMPGSGVGGVSNGTGPMYPSLVWCVSVHSTHGRTFSISARSLRM